VGADLRLIGGGLSLAGTADGEQAEDDEHGNAPVRAEQDFCHLGAVPRLSTILLLPAARFDYPRNWSNIRSNSVVLDLELGHCYRGRSRL
jgi:hypothetical protein